MRKSISGCDAQAPAGPQVRPPAAHHDRIDCCGSEIVTKKMSPSRSSSSSARPSSSPNDTRSATGSADRGVRAYGVACSTVTAGSSGSFTVLSATRLDGSSAVTPMVSRTSAGEHDERDRPGSGARSAAPGRCPPTVGGPGLTCRPACRSTISPFGWPGSPAWPWLACCWPGGVRLPERSRNDHADLIETPRRVPYQVREAVAPPVPAGRARCAGCGRSSPAPGWRSSSAPCWPR